MKTFKSVKLILCNILFCILILTSSAYSNAILRDNYALHLPSNLKVVCITEHTQCTVVEVVDNEGKSFFHIIAAVATAFLPNILEALCERRNGDPEICNLVHDAASWLVIMKGEKMFSAATYGYKWLVHKGKNVSTAAFDVSDYRNVEKIKAVLDLYKDRCERGNGIPWHSVEVNPGFKCGGISDEFYHLNENVFASIKGSQAQVRKAPEIDNNFYFFLNKNNKVKVLGYKIATSNFKYFITSAPVKLWRQDGSSYIKLPNSAAVEYVGMSKGNRYLVNFYHSNGSIESGTVDSNFLLPMDKKWFRITIDGKIGWIYEDLIQF